MARAVFLDRDGVINSVIWRGGQPGSPRSLTEFHIDSGASAPLERLRAAGLRLFVITNQPDVARGLLSPQTLEQMNQQVVAQLPIEGVVVCPHDDRDECPCRKPRPGMLKTLAAGEHIELGHSFVIGDTWRDVQAARAAGCIAIMLDRNYNRRDEADYRVGNLAAATQLIIRKCEPMNNELNGYIETYLEEAAEISRRLSRPAILKMVEELIALRRADGRLFILGVGGSAANASHAVNDFRKIADIESYTPTDNVAELTARINDDGWDSSYAAWLRASRLGAKDALLIFSVGGGNEHKRVSVNLVEAIRLARSVNAKVLGVVGRDGGYTAQVADACVVIPNVNGATVTPHTEAFQAVVWHLIVSHPELRANEMKWEAVR